MDNLANAIRVKDVAALMAHYAPDVGHSICCLRYNTREPTRSEKSVAVVFVVPGQYRS